MKLCYPEYSIISQGIITAGYPIRFAFLIGSNDYSAIYVVAKFFHYIVHSHTDISIHPKPSNFRGINCISGVLLRYSLQLLN